MTETHSDIVTHQLESAVSYYRHSLPALFDQAHGSHLYTADGQRYLDFFCGAGALNYGHNSPDMVDAVVDHLRTGKIVHAMDCDTPVKQRFLELFDEVVLRPRGFDHHVQFCGPTGTNAIEAALRLARKVTGRSGIIAFSGSFHGMTSGSLAVGSKAAARRHTGLRGDVSFLPYPVGRFGDAHGLERLRQLLSDPMSGTDLPAAVIVEPVQMDGGINSAPGPWLAELAEICRSHDILLIFDEIQSGCGRTDSFLASDHSGVAADMIAMSKSLSGMGLPLSVLLIRPSRDGWSSGEHTGTFRANQLALTTAAVALSYWTKPSWVAELDQRRSFFTELMRAEVDGRYPDIQVRGRGMAWAVDFGVAVEQAHEVQRACFRNGLVVEQCGRDDEVVKLFPPLTATEAQLAEGVRLLVESLDEVLAR